MKSLVFFQLNEVDFNFISKNSKKFGYNFKFLRKTKKIITKTSDIREGFNLDPWVQWVSINTGKNSKTHGVYNLGQKLDKKYDQIWDTLSKKKINSSIWCSMNANLRQNKYINFFVPDPWNFSQKTHPKKLNDFLLLPKYFSQNYKSFNILKVFMLGIIFFKSVIKLGLLKSFFSELPFFILNILKNKNRTLIFYLFLDLMLLHLVHLTSCKKKNSGLCIIFINSIAHFQHNYWDDKTTYKLFFFYLNRMLNIIDRIKKNYNNFFIANGLSQTKIKPIYICKISNPEKFFNDNKIIYKNIEPNMTTGGTIFFNNNSDKKKCVEFFLKFKSKNQSLFYFKQFKKQKKIYFRFDVILQNKLKKVDNSNYSYIKIEKVTIKQELIREFNKVVDYLSLIKSTSIHNQEGSLYHSNCIKNHKVIYNHEIYDLINKYFNSKK